MLQDWAFAQKGHGIIIQTARGDVTILEFNEFLGRIASGRIGPDDIVVSQVMTDGVRQRVGDLKLYAQVVSGHVPTESLPRRVPGGVLATGSQAAAEFQSMQLGGEVLTTCLPLRLPSTGTVLTWLFALLGFSLLCSHRPGTRGTRPAPPVYFRPATHPEHPPWLPR